MSDQFDKKSAQALLNAMKTLAETVLPDKIENPSMPGPGTPDNIKATLSSCPGYVQAIYRELTEGWKAAGGTVQCARPGRIYLKMKTKEHKSGRFTKCIFRRIRQVVTISSGLTKSERSDAMVK
jgi:hypothetical protein